jgi:hypothetical protein
MQKFAALSGFVSTKAGGDFHPGVRREPRFLTPGRLMVTDLARLLIGVLPGCQRSIRNYLDFSELPSGLQANAAGLPNGASSIRSGEAGECRRTSEGEGPSCCH